MTRKLTKRDLDAAIKSGAPMRVRIVNDGDAFLLGVTDYDRRIIRGAYNWNGRICDAAFNRSDVLLAD